MGQFKGSKGAWRYLPAFGEVKSDKSGLIADLIVNGKEDENGQLIAAAPDLLIALDLILSYHDDGNCVLHREDVSRARAAIKKALGQ